MKKVLQLLSAIVFSFGMYGQMNNVYVLRPFPGENSGNDQGTELSGKDAFVTEFYPSSNYGDATSIYAHPTSNCNNTKANAFLKFHMMDFPNITSIDSAFLGFTHIDHTSYCYSNCYAEFHFSYIESEWNEQEVTYYNQPMRGDAFYGPIPISFPNSFGLREYKITNAFYNWYNNLKPNNGFVIHSESVGCNNAAVSFHAYSSDEADVNKRPYLKVYYKSTPVGINSTEFTAFKNIRIFPNPARDKVYMAFNSETTDEVSIKLLDMSGRLIRNYGLIRPSELNFYETELNLESLKGGVYHLQLSKDGKTLNRKIVIED